MTGTELDVAVVGAGPAGLAVANALQAAGREVHVFEAADRVGGRMATLRRDGYLIDTGAEQLATNGYPVTWRWLREVGVQRDAVPLLGKQIAMWRAGRAHPGVAQPHAVLTGAGLSVPARLDLARFLGRIARQRALFDPAHPERTPLGTATVADLANHYHPDLGDYLLRPVVGTFCGWDPARSAAAPFVCLLNAVGSTSTWRTYAEGMDLLARRLADRVPVTTGRAVREVVAERNHARLVVGTETLVARTVVLAVPAPVAVDLHRNPAEAGLPFLAASSYTPMLKVSCLASRPLPPPGGGPTYLLVSGAEDPVLGGVVFDHRKHSGRAPTGRGLLTLIAAPAVVPELLAATDDAVADRLIDRAEYYVPGLRAATTATVVHRFRHGLPEATPVALRLRAGFLARPTSTVEYAGDWVALVPNSEGALRSADLAVSRVLAHRAMEVVA